MKKNIFIFLLSFLMVAVWGQNIDANDSAKKANRKTATRYLKLAENFISAQDYKNALSEAKMGLSYDDEISDLWYVKAVAKKQMNAPRYEVLDLVEKAIQKQDWVDYNKDGSRVLYADILCDTGKLQEAIDVLDKGNFIYSADAEFIRAKAYYKMFNHESVEKAREKIRASQKIYTKDLRFLQVFFKYEYMIKSRETFKDLKESFSEAENQRTKKIADALISKINDYKVNDASLQIYSVLFSSGEEQERLLKAFSASGFRHPLFAHASLEKGLMTENESWTYFYEFFDEEMSLDLIEEMLSLIKNEETIESVKEHFLSYNGQIYIDADNDGETEIFVKYERGRPKSFWYDKNNDEKFEWQGKCDFGNPTDIFLSENNADIFYETFPFVEKIVYNAENEEEKLTFNMSHESFSFSPFKIAPLDCVKKLTGDDFFVVLPENEKIFDKDELLKAASSYEVKAIGRENAKIVFSVLDGVLQYADYFENEKLYAHLQFIDGKPNVRSVDTDGDGIFEMTETIVLKDADNAGQNKQDDEQVEKNLFGFNPFGYKVFLKMIQLDFDDNTVVDFSEEYFEDGTKISSWDYNADGFWDFRYKKYPQKSETDAIIEESQFHWNDNWDGASGVSPRLHSGQANAQQPPLNVQNDKYTSVLQVNGEPRKVTTGEKEFDVTQGATDAFYWVGKAGDGEDENFVLNHFRRDAVQGVSVVLQKDEKRIIVVRVGENIYANILQ